jgi:HJR/Mrr/RecB family endonuclease
VAGPGAAVVVFRFLRAAIDGATSPQVPPRAALVSRLLRRGGNAQRPVAQVDLMSGWQFEDYVAHMARSCGLPVIMTSVTGDWGVDLIVGHRPHRLAIQCKRHSRPVGAGAVQQVVAGAPMHGCTRTMVVSNQGFTPAAHELAKLHDCTLIGGSELSLLRGTIRRIAGQSGIA